MGSWGWFGFPKKTTWRCRTRLKARDPISDAWLPVPDPDAEAWTSQNDQGEGCVLKSDQSRDGPESCVIAAQYVSNQCVGSISDCLRVKSDCRWSAVCSYLGNSEWFMLPILGVLGKVVIITRALV